MCSNEADHLLVGIDRDALSDQILAYHRRQRVAGDVLRMAALGEATRIEIRLAVELHYSGSDAIGVRKFLFGVGQKFLLYRLRFQTIRYEVVAPVTQGTHDLGRSTSFNSRSTVSRSAA